MSKKVLNQTEESAAIDVTAESNVEVGEDASKTPLTLAPAKAPLLKRAVYNTVYAISFGTVFTSLLVKKLLIPKNGVIDTALHDGAVAARVALEEHERLVAETVKETRDFLAGKDAAPAAA